MGRSWNERGTYGNILKNMIKKQLTKFEKERNKTIATKISQNVGYLIQVQNSLIKDHETSELEKRIEHLEEIVNSKGGRQS